MRSITPPPDEPTSVTIPLTLTVNGRARDLRIEGRELLVHVLRDTLGLTGTHIGCDTTQCGACTVLIDAQAVKSCAMLAVQAVGREITTIEAIGADGLHPVQQAFREKHGLQCGFCTPGMILTTIDLLSQGTDMTDEAIRDGIQGNICRCTGYQNIVDSIHAAAAMMRAPLVGSNLQDTP